MILIIDRFTIIYNFADIYINVENIMHLPEKLYMYEEWRIFQLLVQNCYLS